MVGESSTVNDEDSKLYARLSRPALSLSLLSRFRLYSHTNVYTHTHASTLKCVSASSGFIVSTGTSSDGFIDLSRNILPG